MASAESGPGAWWAASSGRSDKANMSLRPLSLLAKVSNLRANE
jgi:hypothetical protein